MKSGETAYVIVALRRARAHRLIAREPYVTCEVEALDPFEFDASTYYSWPMSTVGVEHSELAIGQDSAGNGSVSGSLGNSDMSSDVNNGRSNVDSNDISKTTGSSSNINRIDGDTDSSSRIAMSIPLPTDSELYEGELLCEIIHRDLCLFLRLLSAEMRVKAEAEVAARAEMEAKARAAKIEAELSAGKEINVTSNVTSNGTTSSAGERPYFEIDLTKEMIQAFSQEKMQLDVIPGSDISETSDNGSGVDVDSYEEDIGSDYEDDYDSDDDYDSEDDEDDDVDGELSEDGGGEALGKEDIEADLFSKEAGTFIWREGNDGFEDSYFDELEEADEEDSDLGSLEEDDDTSEDDDAPLGLSPYINANKPQFTAKYDEDSSSDSGNSSDEPFDYTDYDLNDLDQTMLAAVRDRLALRNDLDRRRVSVRHSDYSHAVCNLVTGRPSFMQSLLGLEPLPRLRQIAEVVREACAESAQRALAGAVVTEQQLKALRKLVGATAPATATGVESAAGAMGTACAAGRFGCDLDLLPAADYPELTLSRINFGNKAMDDGRGRVGPRRQEGQATKNGDSGGDSGGDGGGHNRDENDDDGKDYLQRLRDMWNAPTEGGGGEGRGDTVSPSDGDAGRGAAAAAAAAGVGRGIENNCSDAAASEPIYCR